MISLHLHEILPHIDGVIIQEKASPSFNKVITRQHKLKANTLFFCLDRNIKETQKPFPSCIIVSDQIEQVRNISGDVTIIKVHNIKHAYRSFLSFYRSLFTIPFIGVTGTYGKTTTKEMINHILSGQFKVKSTIRNYNLFRSNSSVLANLEDDTDFAVFEFGVGKLGHLNRCCQYFAPFTAVITGIGVDHIERFGTFENYRREKANILNGVGEDQTAILNADCHNTFKISKLYPDLNKIWFGLGENADFKAQNIKYSENSMDFNLVYNQNTYSVHVPCFGIHNVYNALAAISTVYSNGVDINSAIEHLKSFKSLKRHVELTKGVKGATIIDDTWNTNSGSIKAALTVLNHLSKGKTTIALLGKISELGEEEENEHKKIAQMVIDSNTKILITIGETASIISKEAEKLGMNPRNIFICSDVEKAKSILEEIAREDSIILIKTSMRESFKHFLRDLKKTI